MASLYSYELWILLYKVRSVDIFLYCLVKWKAVSVFFAKFNEVSSEAGNLRILLEAPWNLLRERGGQVSMRFVCVGGEVALVLNGIQTSTARIDFGVPWAPKIACKAGAFVKQRSLSYGTW